MSNRDQAKRETEHKISVLETRKRSAYEVLNDLERRREEARRRHELDPGDVRSEMESLGLSSALIALRHEIESIETTLGYWRAHREQIDSALG